MKIRRARAADAGAIHAIISEYAAQGILLARSLEEIRRHAARFLVLADEEPRNGSGTTVYGCVALEPYGTSLAEVRSLAVLPGQRGAGLGRRLLRFALRTAKQRGVERVFAVTGSPQFFLRHGFTLSSRHALPEKVAHDCRVCPKERTCRLTAVVKPLQKKRVLLPVLTEEAETAVA